MTGNEPFAAAVHDLYREAALTPDNSLCCLGGEPWNLPDLEVPDVMWEMNYGCGTTVQPRDIPRDGAILYVGVGGGLEVLQFASLARRSGAVIGVDCVDEMLDKCRDNLGLARSVNSWLTEEMIDLRQGDALALPIADATVGLFAQNCLFNVFREADLTTALSEAHRVLVSGGALSMSDPVCDQAIPQALQDDPRLRAACLSGALPLDDYLARVVAAGFGMIEVRARRPYRVLDTRRYDVEEHLFLESVEIVAYKTEVPPDGPCIFTGRTATWIGDEDEFDDGRGHCLVRDVPLGVCDKTAAALAGLNHPYILTTGPTWHYAGGGCC